jgi:ribosomal protein S18 acetylase RimI-like enzyme
LIPDKIGNWRRRRIARALRNHWLDNTHLTMDSSNKNQALTLYESVGMHVTGSSHTYVKELRPGVNLVAQ